MQSLILQAQRGEPAGRVPLLKGSSCVNNFQIIQEHWNNALDYFQWKGPQTTISSSLLPEARCALNSDHFAGDFFSYNLKMDGQCTASLGNVLQCFSVPLVTFFFFKRMNKHIVFVLAEYI